MPRYKLVTKEIIEYVAIVDAETDDEALTIGEDNDPRTSHIWKQFDRELDIVYIDDVVE